MTEGRKCLQIRESRIYSGEEDQKQKKKSGLTLIETNATEAHGITSRARIE
jgi:hypothetical protein